MSEHGDSPGLGGRADEAAAGDAMEAEFGRWAARERAAGAASARSRERLLRQQAVDDATFSGVLVDLAERNAAVVVQVGGTAGDLRGRLVGIGQDFLVLEEHGGPSTMVALCAVDSVAVEKEVQRLAPEPTGDPRSPSAPLDLADALAGLAADRAPVRLRLEGGQTITGELLGVGRDVLWLRERTMSRTTLYVPLAAVLACSPC